MTWERSFTVLSRYYGISPLDIPEMTIYQYAYYMREIGWIESQGQKDQKGRGAVMGQTDKVPSIADIRRMAKEINPDLVIPKD